MKRSVGVVLAISMFSTAAFAQVRPQDCQPVFPVVDKVATVLPQDVVAQPAAPTAVRKRGFFGLPFLLPALAGLGGGIIALADNGGGGGGGEPPPVSPV